MTRKTLKKKRPKEVPLTFDEGEEELLRVLDHKLEKELYITRSDESENIWLDVLLDLM
tara:strand:+ start:89 stop:262 length:174 start_codon:yes stop_codon:yes gene_type:complete